MTKPPRGYETASMLPPSYTCRLSLMAYSLISDKYCVRPMNKAIYIETA